MSQRINELKNQRIMMSAVQLDDVSTILKRAFGDMFISWVPVGINVDATEFSGASLKFIQCELETKSLQLCLKQTPCQTMNLAADASEEEKIRAQRYDFSYANECTHLKMRSEAMNEAGVRVPQVYLVDESKDGNSFNILMEALPASDGWEQLALIPSGAETTALIRWLAMFHSLFFPKEIGGNGLLLCPENGHCWDYGRHMALERRPTSELAHLPKAVVTFFDAFRSADPYFAAKSAEDAKLLGIRLQTAAPRVAHRMHPLMEVEVAGTKSGGLTRPFITLCHGDLKQGNMMFKRKGKEPEIALFDWQWTGPGLGASDLFYVVMMGLDDIVVEDYEEYILKPYHKELSLRLSSEDSYPYELLLKEFKLSGIDFMRWLTVTRLKTFNVEKLRKSQAAIDVNHGLWRRSVPRLVWAWQMTETWLNELDLLLL